MTLAEFVTTRGLVASAPAPGRSGAAVTRTVRRQLSVVLANATATAVSVVFAFETAPRSGHLVWLAAAFVEVVLIAELLTLQPYERSRSLRPAKHLVELAGAGLLSATVFEWLNPDEVRGAVLVVAPAAAVMSVAVVVSTFNRAPRAVLVVGCMASAGQLIAQWANRADVDVRGLCLAEDTADVPQEVMGVPVLGAIVDAVDAAMALAVTEVVVAPGPQFTAEDVRRLGWALERSGIELGVLADVHGALPHRIEPRILGRRMLLSVRPGRQPRLVWCLKGLIDRVGAAVLICLCSPLFGVVAVAVRHGSRGPAFFRQIRVGLDGKPFSMYKFRTMVVDAEILLADLLDENEGAGPMFKMADDPRTTRVGRFLRRTSLDELPQLVNVLKGDMSLIGPRPCLPAEASQYDGWVGRRLRTKPGMTGAWQVSGRSNLSWQDSVRLDIDYVDNWTIRGDFAIAAKTTGAVIKREGAL